MWAASLEWPLALRTARRVSTRVDLTAGSDESPSPRRWSKNLESADLDPRWTAGLDLPVPDPSTPETMKLPVAVERSESPWRLVTERSSAELEGPSWMAGTHTGGPSRCPGAPTWHSSTRPWGPDTAIQTWWVVCWRMSQTSRPVARPTWQTRVVDAPWSPSTRCSVSGPLWTVNPPGCCALLADGREPTWSPCDRTTLAGVSSSALLCTIVCLPRSLYKPQSRHCRTSSKPPRTSDEAGSLSQRWWRPASSERWCATIFEMLTTVPVSSVSLTGLPSPNWTHPWRESLPSPWWPGEDLVGLLEMPTRPPLTAPTEELWSSRPSSRSSGTMLWRPTTGPDEDGVFPAVPEKPWTPACPVICADRGLWCLGWSSSVDERTELWDASSVGAPLWIVECWTASRWTGSPDLEWGLTFRSWWSTRETGAPWLSSGHAAAPVWENLHGSASRLSRRVASHLAALTTLRLVVRAWWTCEVKLPIWRVGKWIGRQILPDGLMHRDM